MSPGSRTTSWRVALVTAICLMLGAIASTSANAALPACTGSRLIWGQGTTLQNLPHGVWARSPSSSQQVGYQYWTDPVGCEATFGPHDQVIKEVLYNLRTPPNDITTGEGALNAWGAGGGAFNPMLAFLGVDDAPTPTQMANIKHAAGGSDVVVVPVAQTAIAIVANPPVGCSITNITRARLRDAFNGTATTWSAIGAIGSGCSGSITRVVRSDAAWSTGVFKQWLALGQPGALACTGMTAQKTWSDLRAASPNTTWPQTSACGHPGDPASLTPLDPETGEASTGLVHTVATTPGTIGYATLPETENVRSLVLNVQVNPAGEPTAYRSPAAAPSSPYAPGLQNANCSPLYRVPGAAQPGGTGLNADWSTVSGNSLVPSTGYGICGLTYVISLSNYETAFPPRNPDRVQGSSGIYYDYYRVPLFIRIAVKDYLGYVVRRDQTPWGNWMNMGYSFAPLPYNGQAKHNVLGAASAAVGKIF